MSTTARRHKASRKRFQQLSEARKLYRKNNKKTDEIPESASYRKLSLGTSDSTSDRRASQQWLILHVSRLNELLQGLICPSCAGSGLQLTIDPQNRGFCSALLLECHLCERDNKYCKSVFTSTRLQEESRSDVVFDVNVRMVLLAHELGLGYAGLKKISKVLGIPGLHLKTYQRHDKKVTGGL